MHQHFILLKLQMVQKCYKHLTSGVIEMEDLLLDKFVTGVIENSDYLEMDRIYLNNRVVALVGEQGCKQHTTKTELIDLKEELVKVAFQNGKVGETLNEQDELGAQLMNFITPAPSKVNCQFWDTYAKSSEQAISEFYALSKRNDYIKTKAIAKNIYYTVETEYGNLEITINLSKPEKDPKAIAAAKKIKATGYPACQLCMENEGYQGRIDYPARANHRIIRFDMNGKPWGFQYSPYAYFNEHCIFLDSIHEPMKISDKTFGQLLNIVDQFTGYFAGSNADLPIVGGSILTHEHYQGGRHVFAMEKALIELPLHFTDYPEVEAGIVKWPMSVIRVSSKNKTQLIELATKILAKWRTYSDEDLQIKAQSEGELHHTITPIARKKEDKFELDLVLRDNQTSSKYPDGIYHPHKDVQHIKKENIGLIEVMGLAILPPRLKTEMHEVEKYLLKQPNEMAAYHKVWADEIVQKHAELNAENVTAIVKEAIGQVFKRVLEDAGVYKQNEEGKAGFLRFAQFVGLNKN